MVPDASSHARTALTGKAIEPPTMAMVATVPSWSFFERRIWTRACRALGAVAEFEIGQVKADKLGAAEGAGKAKQQDGAAADPIHAGANRAANAAHRGP